MIRLALILLLAVLHFDSAAASEPAKRIALTYDDAPRNDAALTGDERAAMLVKGLEKAGVEQAALFFRRYCYSIA